MIRQTKEQSLEPDSKSPREVLLQTVKKRVEAESKVQDKPFVRILALALRWVGWDVVVDHVT